MNDIAAIAPQSLDEAGADTPGGTQTVEPADGPSAADMVPMDGAFDTIAHGAATSEAEDADEDTEVTAPRQGLLARLRGLFRRGSAYRPGRSRWAVPAMIAGGLLAGIGASSAVAWKMIATRNADVESHAAVVEEQTRMLAAQAAKIETLLREEEQTRLLAAQAANIEILLREADGRQPVVEPPATEAVTRGAAPARQAASAATAAAAEAPAARPPAPAAATEPVARSAEAPRAPEPAPAQEGPAKRERTAQAEPTRAGSPPPRESGSGMCDVPPGKDAARSMRRCIDWFNGVDSSATRPSK